MSSIARQMACRPSTVSRLIKKVRAHKTVEDLPRPGRPKKTTARQDRLLVAKARVPNSWSARIIAALSKDICLTKEGETYIRSHLKIAGMMFRRKLKKFFYTR